MNGKAPHLVQYQGSKRILANQILEYIPNNFSRLIEPFSGMAAISIAVSSKKMTNKFLINDINKPIVKLLESTVNNPLKLYEDYSNLWNEQFKNSDYSLEHFYKTREQFNCGNHSPEVMLYLLARCVKGAVRYSKDGKFNQSPDKRRNGTNPKNIKINALKISTLLNKTAEFASDDYRNILEFAKSGDVVYLDPPYQGVSNVSDNRYLAGVSFNEFIESIECLNKRDINYLISYDGQCGQKSYGKSLPKELECTKLLLNAGRSAQATLLGKSQITYESLYISKGLSKLIIKYPEQIKLEVA